MLTNLPRSLESMVCIQRNPKCKELRISFSTTNDEFKPIIINNKEIEVDPCATLLGLSISNDFKWNTHVENVCKKVSSRLYFLRQLKQAKLPSKDLLLFYVTCIRLVAEYVCVVFHDSLPKYLSDYLKKLQKRACRIILPGHSYENAFNELSLTSLANRRQNLTNKFFKTIVNEHKNKLYHLLPTLNHSEVSLRVRRQFLVPNFKTIRCNNDFINCNSSKYIEYT
jgi:hypothetical protein